MSLYNTSYNNKAKLIHTEENSSKAIFLCHWMSWYLYICWSIGNAT